jgi:glycosyltransferase involved in cell wall biosynthesis
MTDEKDKKTVLHFITGLEAGGGAETMLARVLPHIASTETVVCSMIPKGEMATKLEKAGVEVRSLNMNSKLDIRGIWRYYQLIQDVQPDVQINYLIHADIFGRIFGSVFGVKKIIAFIRNRHEETLFRLAEKVTIRLIDCLLTNSPATMRFYRDNYTLPDCQKVLPNGVEIPDIDNLDASYLYDELPLTKDTNVLACVARLHEQKDHDTLLNAFAKLLDEHPHTKLVLCGDGPRKKGLQRLADKLGIAESVLFLGRRSDINEILKITDVFVLPSRFEGMSNALLEAMAMARPCVVSDIPENTELVTDEKNGLTFTAGNSSDCRQQLQSMLENPDERKELGEQAKDMVKNQYSVQAERNRFDDFLATI